MKSETTGQRICRFGVYEADFQAGTLKRHGIPLRVQEQPFRVLGVLLERPGQIVSREELRDRLWPAGTFVEFGGSLNTALMKLRAVLNDDSENPRFVETVPKKGYRFIAPIEELPALASRALGNGSTEPQRPETVAEVPVLIQAGNGGDADSARTEIAAQSRAAFFTRAVLLLSLMVLAVGIALVWRFWPQPEPQVMRVAQLTHTGRVASGSRVVTDGARVYFVSQDGGQWSLMTTSIRGGSVEKLASPFASTTIFDVSPDRTQLLIGPSTQERTEVPVWIWPAHGGVPQRLGDVVASEAEWSPKGDSIAIAQGNRLLTVRPDGSQSRELQNFSAYPHALTWSGDGTRIRFTLTNLEHATDEMWEIHSDGTGLRRVLSNAASEHDTTGVWSSDDNYFLFTRGSDSRLSEVTDSASNVWAIREHAGFFRRPNQMPGELTHGPVSFQNLAATGDSNSFFALGTHPEYQLVRVHPVSGVRDIILPDAGATDVDVTPDGEWLVYSLRENGALWKSRRNGKERQELTATPPGAIAPQWSPDNKEVLFTAYFLSKRPQIYVVPSAGGTPHPIVPENSAGSSASGDWAPDGNRILFDYFENVTSELRVLDRAAHKIETVTGSQGMVQGRWSPDGKHIAAIQRDKDQIALFSLKDLKWTVMANEASVQGMRWSADSNFIYFQKAGDPELAVYRIRLGSTKSEKILGFAGLLGSMASQCRFTGVAPDGSIYATIDRGGTDLYALEMALP
jgi:Tol biopolymer transport system component/DNA-binding winged helix-turn-helix (wHTH) protein